MAEAIVISTKVSFHREKVLFAVNIVDTALQSAEKSNLLLFIGLESIAYSTFLQAFIFFLNKSGCYRILSVTTA